MFPFVWWWKPPVARHKIVGQDCQQTFPGRVDDPAANDAGCVAAKAHAHTERLFSAGTAALKGFIQIIGNTGQISGILKQGKERKEI